MSITSNINSGKPVAGETMPVFAATTAEGESVILGGARDRWTLLIVYRGKHCGRCKKYLNILEAMKAEWDEAGFDIQVVSADTIEKLKDDLSEHGWSFPIACELTEQDMRRLGLYISDPLSANETDRRFAEPGVFCLRPDGSILLASISNGPSARPELAELLDGMKFTIANDRPARGTVV